LAKIHNLGANDIYRWYLASSGQNDQAPPDLKLNLIWPCTEQHILKYSAQMVRMVTETPQIYRDYVRPYMQSKRENGRLNWVFNIIEGRKEQEDVIIRESGQEEGFLLLPDLNWDRKTLGTLRLLALVERRDLWSLRDLTKGHVPWLKRMRAKLLDAAVKVYPELDRDQLKMFVHCKQSLPGYLAFSSQSLFRPLLTNTSVVNLLKNPLSFPFRTASRSADLLSFPRSCCERDAGGWHHAGDR
jgi:m7GpppX diphosphatase